MEDNIIHEFKWLQQESGEWKHKTVTTVGQHEKNDQIAYITQLEQSGIIKDAEYHLKGRDI